VRETNISTITELRKFTRYMQSGFRIRWCSYRLIVTLRVSHL